MDSVKKKMAETYELYRREIEDINSFIFSHPELSDEEFESSRYLVDTLKKHSFDVQFPYCGLPTAFRAEAGSHDGPRVALLAEYDALPGFRDNGEPAHACGHSWIAAHAAGTAIVLSKHLQAIKGRVVVIGTPAEETVGRKYDLIQQGAFDDIDAVMQMHLENNTTLQTRGLAMDAVEFKFYGKAAHAAQNPHNGINALDAAQLTFAGINALRQHITPDARIHGIIAEGGAAANIVPDFARVQFYVRATSRDYLNALVEKVINCAKGAALMTGARLEHVYFENPFDDLLNNAVMQGIVRNNMQINGFSDISEEPEEMPGSSDIGNVSHVCPTCYVNIAIGNGVCVHDREFIDVVDTEESRRLLRQCVLTSAYSAFDILTDETCLEGIKNEFCDNVKKISQQQ